MQKEKRNLDSCFRRNDQRMMEWYMGPWYKSGGGMVDSAHPDMERPLSKGIFTYFIF